MDKIKITNLKVFAHHGVFPEETQDGQDFYINAKLYLDCRKAGKSDELTESVNYADVCYFITDFLQKHTYQLIEAAAEHLIEAMLLSMPLLKKVKLELCKPHAPVGLPFENVSVTMERGWHTVYLSIGSNMGDRYAYLKNGIAEIQTHPLIREVIKSSFIETKPYGPVEQADFLNGCLRMDTLLTPEELLIFLHEVEAHADRKRTVVWGPRTLDLDILFYDKIIYESDNLIIPHVDLSNRLFVLKPLLELCPNYRHPLLGKTVGELYAVISDKESQQGAEKEKGVYYVESE